jgi:His-Xaa-Ser system radical SAM maturase HxsB
MSQYLLLPFNFKKINNEELLLVNQAGEFYKISRDDFEAFHTHGLDQSSIIYKELKAKHFLSTLQDVDLAVELLSTKLRTRKAFISDFTALHMIVVTLRCNCQCRYCHASSVDVNQKGYDMDWETAKNTIDMIFQSPCNCLKIEYQGGEPLLNWEIIKQSVLYAEFLNKIAKKQVEFIICSNLMTITDERLKFCKKHKIELSTSLDGRQHVHDLHRKSRNTSSSYNDFIKNLPRIKEILGECSPLLTITRDNLNCLRDVINHYCELGFCNIFLRALNPYGNAIVNSDDLSYLTEEFISAYKDALNYIIELNIQGHHFVESYATLFLRRILTPFSTGFVDLQSPSGAGISGAIYYYNGEVYPADEARMLARMGDNRFLMGNVNKNSYKEIFNSEVMHELVYNSCVETMPVCSECAYQQYCGADPIRNYLETEDLMGDRLNSGFCNKNKLVMDYLFELILQNDEKIMDVFWSWIMNRKYKEVCIEAN